MSILNNNWVSLAVYGDQFEPLLINVIVSFANDHKHDIPLFMFNRSQERGNNLILMFNITRDEDKKIIEVDLKNKLTDYLKIYPFKLKKIEAPVADWFLPFQNNHIEYNSIFLFDIMETGGLQASFVAQNLLCVSSNLLLNIFEANEGEWNPEESIGIALQIQIALVSALTSELNEVYLFYKWAFNNILEKIQGEPKGFIEALTTGLEDNFEEQKEGISEFVGYLFYAIKEDDLFEEEWLNNWVNQCKKALNNFKTLQVNHTYFTPENFQVDKNINVEKNTQELWPVIEYLMRAINSQMGIKDGIELNLLYTLMRGSACLIEEI